MVGLQYQPQAPISAQPYVTTTTTSLTYPGYEPPKATFFEQKVAPHIEAENSLANDFEVMKKKMS